MRIEFVEIQNFRKLKSIRIDFNSTTTLFVGANNSGKTSAIDALGYFLVEPKRFTTNEFTLSNWARIDQIGAEWEVLANQAGSPWPSIADWESVLPSMDLWFRVEMDEIHYVSHLLPSLGWEGGLLGVRLMYEPEKIEAFYKEYISARKRAKETLDKAVQQVNDADLSDVKLWPRTMREFLERRLKPLFLIRVYPLDPTKLSPPADGSARPQPLPAAGNPIEPDPLSGLMRIDVIYAQRDFADVGSTNDRTNRGERRERRRLSTQLRAYYDKHLDPLESPAPSDIKALQAIEVAENLFDPQWSVEKRPTVVRSKPANERSRDLLHLAQFLLLRQVHFCAPAPWPAFQDVTVMEQAVKHGGDGGAVAE